MVMAMAMTGQFFILAALTPNQPAPYKIPALTVYGFLFKCHLTVEVHNATCFLYKSAKLMIRSGTKKIGHRIFLGSF